MLYSYKTHQERFSGRNFWIAESQVLKGCVGQGDTEEKACEELRQNELVWLEAAKDLGIPIPPEKQHQGE